ncbi:YceI family protein [Candidatus Parcubacteria bacterium]|nr:YceI family protein [Candidatus Parcubacteria bacterium]
MKKIIIIIIAVVALILLAFQAGLFSFTNQTDQAEEVQNDTNNTPSETASISESFQNENTETYQIVDQSTVSYTAQKEFFSKPTEAVVGTTNDVDGQIYINDQENKISVAAEINPQTLNSGSGGRDNYVSDLFGSNISVITEEIDLGSDFNLDLENGSENQISFSAPISITINGVTNSEIFEISGTVTEGRATFSGSTQTTISSYGITTPSAAGIYTVNDNIEISFDLVAER